MSNSSIENQPKTSRKVMIATVIMGVVILIPSMIGFVNKLFEFQKLIKGDPEGAFAMTPVTNYTLASLGFFCLLIWATAQGMFHNIEGPKHTMLGREAELDTDEEDYVPEWAGGTRKPKQKIG